MPKNRKKEKEALVQLMKEYESSGELQEEDLYMLTEFMHELSYKTSIRAKVIDFLKIFVFRFLMFLCISLVGLGFLFNSIELEQKYYIVYVALGVSGILSLFEMLPILDKNRKPMLYFILFGLIVLVLCLLNQEFRIFKHSSLWIVYILQMEGFYTLIMYKLVHRKNEWIKEK